MEKQIYHFKVRKIGVVNDKYAYDRFSFPLFGVFNLYQSHEIDGLLPQHITEFKNDVKQISSISKQNATVVFYHDHRDKYIKLSLSSERFLLENSSIPLTPRIRTPRNSHVRLPLISKINKSLRNRMDINRIIN